MNTGQTQGASTSVGIATLDLPATDAMPRSLYLNLGLLSGNLIAMICVNHRVVSSAYSMTHELDEHAAAGPCLRVGTARFALLPEEVEPVRAFLQTASPCPEKTIGPNSAKQAAPVTPPDGSCRESPPPDARSSGGGALGEPGV